MSGALAYNPYSGTTHDLQHCTKSTKFSLNNGSGYTDLMFTVFVGPSIWTHV